MAGGGWRGSRLWSAHARSPDAGTGRSVGTEARGDNANEDTTQTRTEARVWPVCLHTGTSVSAHRARESLAGDTQLWPSVLTAVSGLRPLVVHVGNTDVPFLLLDPLNEVPLDRRWKAELTGDEGAP